MARVISRLASSRHSQSLIPADLSGKQLGFDCGPTADGCGGLLQCGDCTPPEFCGGGGSPNVCGGVG